MQILRANSGTTKSKTLGTGPAISALASPPGESDAGYSLRTTGLGKRQWMAQCRKVGNTGGDTITPRSERREDSC